MQFSDSVWQPRFLVEEAKILLYQGKNPEAIQLLSGAGAPKITSPELDADRLLILALAYARTGNKLQSKASVTEVESLYNSVPGKKGELWLTQGLLAFDEDQPKSAEEFFNRSLVAARASHDQFLEARSSIGLSIASLQQYHYEDALEQSAAAIDIAHKIDAHGTLITAKGNSGWAYYQTGDYARALANFSDAATEAAKLGLTSDEEHWLITAGMSEDRLGDLEAARKHYTRALALARSLQNTMEITYVDQALASLLLRTTNPAMAERYIHEARYLAAKNNSDVDIQTGSLLEAQLLLARGNFSQADSILLNIEKQARAFPTVQLDAQHTLAQVSEKLGNSREAETWYRRSIATYREQRSQLKTDDARLPFFENGRSLYMDYVAFLIRNHRTDDALEIIDQGRAETLAEGLEVENKRAVASRPASLRQLALRSHAVILVYALSSPASYLWASNGKDSGFYLLPDRAAILAQVTNHQRAVLAARDLVTEQHPAARTLYDMLVKPSEQLIHPGDRVFIVGAGGLSDLNFETLLTPGKSSHYWIEDVTITHFSSLRFLTLHRREPVPGSSRLLIIGNPVYAGGQYSPLPNAATEVKDVAAHFPAKARTILTGADATPGAYLRSEPAHFEYIHFVAHATASRLVPLDSAVILSGQETQSPAKLYARDILSRPLDAELVTISACQGSGVRTYAGEGLVGLAWAFLRAGSRNVIGALWDVSDASTPELMQRLYDGIAAGQPPDAALRAAKLQMLHTHGVFRKPLYWGAFQLYSSGQ